MGEAVLVDRGVVAETIEREPADGRITARKEALAQRQVVDLDFDRRRDHLVDVGSSWQLGHNLDRAAEGPGEPDAGAGRENDPRRPRNLTIEEGLHECLDESNFGPDRSGSQLRIHAEDLTPPRIGRVVTRVSDDAPREHR